MPIIYIDSLDHPGVDIFYALTEAQLRNKQHSDKYRQWGDKSHHPVHKQRNS